jgi:hypothetical protein
MADECLYLMLFPYDPTENAIQISGEADGIFNNEIYLFMLKVLIYNQESLTNINLQ